MDTSVLGYIFNVCVLVGFAIPLLNILMGWFGDFFSFDADVDADLDSDLSADLDTGIDLDGGGGGGGDAAGIFPFNMMCLCLFLVVFGVTGNFTKRWMSSVLTAVVFIAVGVIIGLVFYVLLYRLVIVRLKRSTTYTISYGDLVGRRAEVTLRITDDSLGMISVLDSTGTFVSFRAKKDPELKDKMLEIIPKGDTVIITEVNSKDKFCYISTSPSEFVSGKIKNIQKP